MIPDLPKAILPLLSNQHVCFGYLTADPACEACVVQTLCGAQRDRKLAEFASEVERFTRLGAPSEQITLPAPTTCTFCRQLMRPDEGKVLHVLEHGTYHLRCADLAFPPKP